MRESRPSGSVRAKAEWLSYSTYHLYLLVLWGWGSEPQREVNGLMQPRLGQVDELQWGPGRSVRSRGLMLPER